MIIVKTGFIEDQSKSYAILDMEESFSNAQEGLDALNAIIGAPLTSTSQVYQVGDGSGYYPNLPNIWSSRGYPALTEVSIQGDSGILFTVNGHRSSGAEQHLIFNGEVPNPGYAKVRPPLLGGIYFVSNLTGADETARTTFGSHSTGTLIKASWNYRYAYFFLSNNGACYFFHDFPGIAKLGYLPSISTSYNHLLNIPALKLYCFRSMVSLASGTIYNAANQPAPNCTVMAFQRATGNIVGKTKSGIDGTYEMYCAVKKGEELFMVCLDDDGVTPDFEAKIIDRIVS